ncbi:protein transport protein Sec16B-like isoform X4 [Hibiscus syriacus]|uniref:Protein transport protein sec16 n=1 Tax=Hibiscus syriacus TaxID=106335 RepID=A0A6A2ZGG9_HIBSY|nr:protein transport protein SEC16A homolog [Hibiscus syriacus]XP_039015828.1 protein transport protein SEC16A homolog [Hibiscus syriacus]KAE8690212.1 protein transport protein Sec16B-like isoform X4 [Hibiscus syriacus]
MASNPSFQVEDHTDEDFFDKLVNDEDDDSMGPTVPKFAGGNHCGDAEAFSNLSIGEEAGSEESGSHGGKENSPVDGGPPPAGNDTSHSFGVDTSVFDSNNHLQAVQSEVVISQSLNENIGSKNAGVKEIGWNSLFSDSDENGVQGFGSYSDFFSNLGENSTEDFLSEKDVIAKMCLFNQNSGSTNEQYHGGNHDEVYGASTADNGNEHDLYSSQYWENMYPGWKYDANSGQWYHADGSSGDGSGNTDVKAGASYLQQTFQSVAGTMTTVESSAIESVANWNQVSQVNNGYPEHMIFDPQYPGWYYDLIAQQWCSLESYNAAVQSTVHGDGQQNQNGFTSTVQNCLTQINSSSMYGEHGQGDNYGSLGLESAGEHRTWGDSHGNYHGPGLNMGQPGTFPVTKGISSFAGNKQLDTSLGLNMLSNNHVNHFNSSYNSLQEVQSVNNANQLHTGANEVIGLQSFLPTENFNHQFTQINLKQNEQMHFSNDFYGGQKSVNAAQQPLLTSQPLPYASNTGRSSAGRPPHALVCFGFGGKLIVIKDSSPLRNSSFGTQGSVGASISLLNLLEVVNSNTSISGATPATSDYFNTLCQQSFPGPLVGGNVGSKDLNKWIDDRIVRCESPNMDYGKSETLRMLLSLLKIACQHYGKLRSPFGFDTLLKETDTPESAVAKLFASAKRKDTPYGALSHCLQQLPAEGQVQAKAFEVQNLLVSGRKKEALQRAQEGQLWGPALVIASQLGEQFYIDTVKKMALHQMVAGSPLRTLCLLIAGQPAEVFSTGSTFDGMDLSQQHAELRANCILDDWEENLAVITANRTKDDELVIIHLGDCLWKERSEIMAAHTCYLVAEANFESYSDSARLCLIGADHLKFPRTYASPEAIQRTELYEYSKVMGNSQFVLLPFQPYKLIYAHMLAEVGKVSDSLKYCQAVLKSLKTSRVPEVQTWKHLVLSLEEKIRFHQQGGYATNSAPAKLVGKLLNFFDSTAHRVVGGLPTPPTSASNGNSLGNDHLNQQTGRRVSASQSTMVMSSLASSSMEPIRDWEGKEADGKMTIHNRSVSEPDIGRTPRQVDSSKEAAASTEQGKASDSVGVSRFSRFSFGSQLLQKTVGLVLGPRADKQAKLGEKNKFCYDEKLKRWVEEGVEPPAEETALPPPPTTAAFQNGTSDYNLHSALKNEGSPPDGSPKFRNPTPIEHASGIPPIPTSSNQFSARGRMGVRARYVDTFNKGGGQANLFQAPAVSSVKPAAAANAKFFIPTPVSTTTNEQSVESITENAQENATSYTPTTSTSSANANESCLSPKPSSSNTRQSFLSMDNISQESMMTNANGYSSHTHQTDLWSESNFDNAVGYPCKAEIRPSGEVGKLPPLFMPGPMSGSFGDELHEVEL